MSSRPTPVTIAAILIVLISLVGLPGPLLPGSEEVPAVVIYGGIVLGIVGIVAAVGLWMLKKWGLWLTIVVSVLNLLSAAPGVAFAPGAVKIFAFNRGRGSCPHHRAGSASGLAACFNGFLSF